MPCLRLRWLLLGMLLLVGTQQLLAATPIEVLKQAEDRLTQLLHESRYPEAEQLALGMVKFAQSEAANLNPDIQPAVRSDLAGVYSSWGQFRNAERISLETITLIEQQFGRDYFLLEQPLTNLGVAYYQQERFAESVQALRRALVLRIRQYGVNSAPVAIAMENLAVSLDNWGYRIEAEPLYQRAMAINLQLFGAKHPTVSRNAGNLGHMYKRENRLGLAEEYFKYILKLPADVVYPRDVLGALTDLAEICRVTGRYDEAEIFYNQAAEMKQKMYGNDHPLSQLDSGRDLLYRVQGRLDEAEKIEREELATSEKFYGQESADYAQRLMSLAETVTLQKRYPEAMELMDRQLAILSKVGERAWTLCDAHGLRGVIAWKLGDHDKAKADFAEAMRLADQLRSQSLGAERERAQSFGRIQRIYTEPGMLYLSAGDFAQAFDCLERGRARSLIDQMVTAHVDLLEGVPPAEAQRLRQDEAAAKTDVASLERQIEVLPSRQDLDDAARTRELERLDEQLALARSRAVDAYSAIRTASPKFRELVGQDFKPVELPVVNDWLEKHQGVLFYYLTDDKGVWLIALGGGKAPRAYELKVTEGQAKLFGIEAGKLTAGDCETLMGNTAGDGVLQLISQPEKSELATPKLAALWQLLVPETERAALLDETVKRLILIPDGSLALLPFETLVTTTDPEAKFLIDVGPAIDYSPSASIFIYLAGRPAGTGTPAREPVLTLGDPAYDASSNPAPQGQAGGVDRSGAQRGQYSRLGGQLTRLPYSGHEASWVADVFGKQGIKAAILKDRLATERMLRGNLAGRKIVHLACHGLCDQSYGNFFGALALAPGEGQQVDPANDGMLSLAEMYELDLTSCELAILSACQTNYGEHQKGEGIWALTRGFIVAGSRRVVASNWLVDDEAAASIISYYCSLLAKEEQAGRTPDYAQALRDAKRWARQQEKWRSPYFWATFVLVGPD